MQNSNSDYFQVLCVLASKKSLITSRRLRLKYNVHLLSLGRGKAERTEEAPEDEKSIKLLADVKLIKPEWPSHSIVSKYFSFVSVVEWRYSSVRLALGMCLNAGFANCEWISLALGARLSVMFSCSLLPGFTIVTCFPEYSTIDFCAHMCRNKLFCTRRIVSIAE